MNDDQSTKLFEYVQKRFDETAQEIENVRQQVGKVYDAVDSIAKQQEIDQHERSAMNHQLDRHERWHQQTAEKLNPKLDYRQP